MLTTSFPNAYASLSLSHLLQTYDAGPERLRAVLTGLADADLQIRTIDGKWSIQEIVLHMADAEIMGAARIRQTLTQSGRDFAYYNQDVWASILGYQSVQRQDVEGALDLFAALRRTTSRLLHRATDDDWQKTGNHAELGEVTVRQLLELYADHSERHLEQILERRRMLGKSLDFNLLLQRRLY